MDTIGKILFTQEQIWRRAEELGQEITEDYAGEKVVLIGTLKGAVPFMADLMKNISLDVEIDFVAASSYGSGTESSGEVILKHDITLDLKGKHVILVEDIIDTGNTIKALKAYLQKRGPKSVSICTLLDKPARRRVDVKGDYIGFVVDDLFIVGYGLDYNQKYRNLPYVGVVEFV